MLLCLGQNNPVGVENDCTLPDLQILNYTALYTIYLYGVIMKSVQFLLTKTLNQSAERVNNY